MTHVVKLTVPIVVNAEYGKSLRRCGMKQTFTAVRCPCGHPACKNWFVEPVAAVTEEQAKAIAEFMNNREWKEEN